MSGNPAAPPEYESRLLLSDLFHQLSQPLTTLCCSLELALLQSPTTEEYCQIVGQALHQAEKASSLANAMREFLEASHPADQAEILDLHRAVSDAVCDLLPVAESAGIEIVCHMSPQCLVWFNARRLHQGLFHLLGSLIGMGGHGSELKIELATHGPRANLDVTISRVADSNGTSEPEPDRELLRRLELGMSRSIFEAADGSFNVERGAQSITVKAGVLRTDG